MRSRSGASLATDLFIQDSWRPRSNLTIEGGLRYVIWPPWYSTTNNIANFDPRFYDPGVAAIINPSTGRITGGSRYNGMVLAGDGFKEKGTTSRSPRIPRCRHCSGVSHADSPRRTTTSSSRAWVCRIRLNPKTILRTSAGIFHNRVLLNDSTLLGGNAPLQPMAVVSAGSVDNPGGGGSGGGGSAARCPGAGRRVQASRRRTCGRLAFSARCRSGSSSMSPMSGAAVSTCRVSATSTSCCRAPSRATRE